MTLLEIAQEYYDYVSDPAIIGSDMVTVHRRIAEYHLKYAKAFKGEHQENTWGNHVNNSFDVIA